MARRMWRMGGLIEDRRGTAVTEFVVVAPLFLALFIGVMEITLQFYYAAAAEKAAQVGVRTAVVVNPANLGLPTLNQVAGSGTTQANNLGIPCSDQRAPCVDFGSAECTGTACGGGFDLILSRMQSIFPVLQANNVRLKYEYIGIGFAGGPIFPAVTLTLTGVQWPAGPFAGVITLLGGGPGATIMPDIRSTLTGEDLTT